MMFTYVITDCDLVTFYEVTVAGIKQILIFFFDIHPYYFSMRAHMQLVGPIAFEASIGSKC